MKHFAARHEGVDPGAVADDGRGASADGIRLLVHDDASAVDDEDALDEVGDLVDEVAGEDDRAGVLGVVGEQAIVEDLPGHGVQAQVGLVEEGDLGAGGEADHHPDGGQLAARELLDRLLHRQLEVVDQLIGEVLVPVREEQARDAERVTRGGVVGVLLALADEAHPLQHAGVLVRALAEDAHIAGGGEVLRGEDRHDRGLAGAVAAEEAVDGVLLDGEADVVHRDGLAVALGEAGDLDDGGHLGSPSVVGGVWCSARSRMREVRVSALRPRRAASARSGSR